MTALLSAAGFATDRLVQEYLPGPTVGRTMTYLYRGTATAG